MKIIQSKELLLQRQQEVEAAYKQAFAGEPWLGTLSEEKIHERMNSDIKKSGSDAFVAIGGLQNQVVGCLLFNTLKQDQLEQEWGSDIAHFAAARDIDLLVRVENLFVSPPFQGQRIATSLNQALFYYLADESSSVLVVARVPHNHGRILWFADKLGYSRTGIQTQHPDYPAIPYEFLYAFA